MRMGKPKLKLNKVIIVATIRGIIAMTGLTITGVVSYTLHFLSKGRLAQFNYRYVSPFFCRTTLRLLGCKVKYPKRSDYPDRKVMYIFNHNSYLDILIIPSMRIPRCRYIISETTKNVKPLYMSNIANGALFIPMQQEKQRRLDFFKRTTKLFKEGSDSVFTSPEGTHKFKHYISKFNKGIFYMAMEAGLPICPIFFHMEKEYNPFESYIYKGGGTTTFDLLPVIETSDWTEENLDEKINSVREIFVQHFNKVHKESIK